MKILLTILFFLSVFISLIYWAKYRIETDNWFVRVSYTIIVIFLAVILVIYAHEPRPIDVYRGNTTLEITYKDGIAIDSTVVFK